MASKLLTSLQVSLQKLEQIIAFTFFRRFPPDAYCLAGINIDNRPAPSNVAKSKFSLKDLIGDGLLWAVPKNRRTIERRLKRKYGSPEYVVKILKPKNHLRICGKCGHYYEVGVLCPHCYSKVLEETKAIQDRIQADLNLEPVEKDVVVLYENEKIDPNSEEFYKNKRIVEMKKPRPSWFSKNLLQKTTQAPATTSDVKPTQLG
ncbi:39S ribosomal protein L32, mitochondrial [Chrysoperla carnea]|uniref:39S ribosomal protein L32, mitochondrial n=1 Tax=Chrysoperla carnea TaxID=189513 RepID=UPI001D094643|nr:39S ribosomal protein L32, mitochondrial [Chrysoperla carnea]